VMKKAKSMMINSWKTIKVLSLVSPILTGFIERACRFSTCVQTLIFSTFPLEYSFLSKNIYVSFCNEIGHPVLPQFT
jgi:hypothetical protein